MKASEKQLIEQCLKNSRKAQQQLYEHFKVPMFRLCLRYARDRAEAEDLLQEGFLKVFTDLKNYRGEGALGGWIRRVMINVALQHIRKQKNALSIVEVTQIEDKEPAEELILSRLQINELIQLIQKLPVGYRTVFNLYVIEGYSHKEIAEQLRINVNTSKSQLSKAKATLRKMLEKSMMS